uniref:Uncharacterized protein n=1 Tax=Arundo donax TaxID=35708 RepID=A0A0A8YHI9_ARUDO
MLVLGRPIRKRTYLVLTTWSLCFLRPSDQKTNVSGAHHVEPSFSLV